MQSIQTNSQTLPQDILIRATNLNKKFCRYLKRGMAYGLVDLSINLLDRKPDTEKLRKGEFWALEDINFELQRGETLGVIGSNGSGKTTLLRLLAGILPPDKGEIAIRGRIAALVAVGAGFHPYMTGRENIFLNGSILGMKKREIAERFEAIVDFAEIEEFLDTPVSAYSPGMRTRLGFAIAIAIEPDILLLDEILAVCDTHFRDKCYERIGILRQEAGLILVSHNMDVIEEMCDMILYLKDGRIAYYGNPEDGFKNYALEKEIRNK